MILKNNNTSCYKNEYIVSYDSGKTWLENDGNSLYFCKKTNNIEIKNLKLISKLLSNKKVFIGNKKFEIRVPKLLKWNRLNKIMYMEYCFGENLEFLLRNKKNHKKGVEFLDCLITFFIKNKIYWADFAPRNIIISKEKIYIVDFEKGIRKNIDFREYLRDNVLEEYCLFLLKEERLFNVESVLTLQNEKNTIYNLNIIKEKRCVEIAKLLGYKEYITKKDYLDIIKMIITIEEPKFIDNEIIFPGVILDKIFTNYPKNEAFTKYAQRVIELYNSKLNNI